MTRTIPMLVALALAFAPAPTRAADPPKLEGDWEGTLKVTDAVSLKIVFHIAKDDGEYSATMDSPDQGAKGLKFSGVIRDKDEVTLPIASIAGEFKGTLSANGETLDGTWSQAGNAIPLKLARANKAAAAAEAKPDQTWAGRLKVTAGIELRLVLNLFNKKDDGFTATLDSPDQGAKGIKVDEVSLDKETLTFAVKSIAGEFSGKLNADKTEAEGEWTQLGNAMKLTLKKTDKLEAEARRPQEPRGPFPYKAIEVSYPNKSAGISLAGTLTLPKGDGPFPSVILITGSGGQDRDETLLGHKPFLILADYLTRRGVAVLRVDDRGVGGSTGSQAKATSADFATDVEAGVSFLKTRKEIDPKRIGLMGHSEGGLIAPMVAAKIPGDVAFVVLLAGTGVPGDEILEAQSSLILKAMGAKAEDVDKQVAIARKTYQTLRTVLDDAALDKALAALQTEALDALADPKLKELGKAQSEAQMKMIKTPWFRYFLTYDPRPALSKVKCPVLAINGENDLQVPPKQNLPEIAKALKSGGNLDVTTRELPGLNHLFQTSKTGAPSEYASIEETFSPKALEVIGDWILGRK